MRGSDGIQVILFTETKLDYFVPADHTLASVQTLVNEALVRRDCEPPNRQTPLQCDH